jgi:hypothetical protein
MIGMRSHWTGSNASGEVASGILSDFHRCERPDRRTDSPHARVARIIEYESLVTDYTVS